MRRQRIRRPRPQPRLDRTGTTSSGGTAYLFTPDWAVREGARP